MIDIQSYALALQIKWSYYFFNNIFEHVWKTIETCALNNHILNVVLRTNLNVTHKLIRKMMPLVTTRTMLHTIKKFFDGIPSDKSLWLNNKLKYKRSPMYIQEFINAGLYDYYQHLYSNGTMITYNAVAQKFGIEPNNKNFLEFIKLQFAIPSEWKTQNSSVDSVFTLETLIEKILKFGKSIKSAYEYIFEKIKQYPIKQQQRWQEVLQNYCEDSINWNQIYKLNYFASNEVKLQSFQIKLNLRAIVTKIALHGMELAQNPNCSFCNNKVETLLHLFCTCPVVLKFWNDLSSWFSAKF